MRWTTMLSTLALLMAATAGCKQQCFVNEGDLKHYQDNLVGDLACDAEASQKHTSVVHVGGQPGTVVDPDRKPRYISLAEAISIALEQGTAGGAGVTTGVGDDTLLRLRDLGGPLVGPLRPSDHIRVLALNPAISGTFIEGALSKFDAAVTTSMVWNVTDRPIGTALDAFQAGRAGALNAIQTDNATFSSSLVKPLPTGGIAGITFNTQYQFTNLPARVNPSYTPSLTFGFEQPLLQGFGVEINELRNAHPASSFSSLVLPALQGIAGAVAGRDPAGEGILLTRISFQQHRADFEADVSQMVLNVEVAYWNLYREYWNLYSRELGLRLAFEFYRIVNARYLAGGTLQTALQDVARARGQYELFRSQRLEALGRVLEAERQLRKFLGMPATDCFRLIPSDTPTVAPYQPDWCAAKEEAFNLRPELQIVRDNIKRAQLSVINQKNFLLPDVRVGASYDINSIGNQLDGPGPSNAFGNLADNKFHNWQMGIRGIIPLGFREAHANLRRARLELARSYALLKDQETKTEQFLTLQYRSLFEFYERIKAQRAQREAYSLQLRLEFERVRVGQTSVAGSKTTGDYTAILEAQRFFSEALAAEYAAIVEYNNSLARFEYAKGTLLQHNNIAIGEGPLPACAEEHTAEHHRKRNAALVLRERATPVHCPNCAADPLTMPHLPEFGAASLPSLYENAPTMPDAKTPEELPVPKKETGGTSALPPGVMEQSMPATTVQPAARLGAPPMGTAARADVIPPARQEPFGSSRMLPGSVLQRDSAPSLQSLGAPAPPMPVGP